jgi:GNAT superfamily N-acetyltransferase
MIRTARPEDVPSLVAAYDWLFAPPGGPPPAWDAAVAADRLRAVLDSDRATVLVADDLTGFCSVYIDILSVRYGQRAWVEDLAVHPGHRSAGIGKALLDAARAWASDHGATHLELDSGDARPDAHRFYEREGPAWTARSFGYTLSPMRG